MAEITITIDDAHIDRVKAVMGQNPKQKIIDLIKEYVFSEERATAMQSLQGQLNVVMETPATPIDIT